MKQFKHWQHTLLSMIVAWILGTFLMFAIAGIPSPGQAVELFLLTGIFAFLAWVVFILPIAGKIHTFFIKKKERKWMLPVLSALYGYLAFVVLFSALMRNIDFMIYPTKIGMYSLAFGFLWGISYLLTERFKPASE